MRVNDNPGSSHSEFLQNALFEFFSDFEHILDVLEFCVLIDFRSLQEILSKVDGCHHRRFQEHSLCQDVVLVRIHQERSVH